ncbi:MAG TPA: thiamine-phosphate kinase [Gemmatimonadaceae bacterium]|nr:thiamine-phosphate kinase [Gemmatimonadaceae bacterium]
MTDEEDAPSVALGAGREFDAIRSMLRVWGPRAHGIGDDAAVIDVPAGDRLVASTDASVEGVHFRRDWLAPREIGARAAAAALSDLAAMAAAPLGMLLALGVSPGWRDELDELARGVGEAAERAGCPILGGNVSAAAELSLTLTALGSTPRPLGRNGLRAGDVLYVTGALGGPGAALGALRAGGTPRALHRARFAAPAPRIAEARWLADAGARAGIDVSDGVVADAGHLAAASGVHIVLEPAALPCIEGATPELAATSGEEYELLVGFSSRALPDVRAFERRFGIALTAVGRASEGSGVVVERDGARVDPLPGHDHLS